MMRCRNFCDLLEATDLFEYLLGMEWVAANTGPLFVGWPAVLVQNGVGYGQLADIMQQSRSPQSRSALAGDPQAVGDFESEGTDPSRMLPGKLRLGIDDLRECIANRVYPVVSSCFSRRADVHT